MYKRILLKLSGEALSASNGDIYDFSFLEKVCREIKTCVDMGTEVSIVIGAGNIWRGRQGGNMDRVRADHMGMLATVINCLAVQDTLEQLGVESKVLTSVEMKQFAEVYTRDNAVKHLRKGRVVIFGAGTGSPYFSTDTAAVLRAIEIKADVVLLAKNVDGVYTADPKIDKTAKKFDKISYKDILVNGLKVIDFTATSLGMDNNLKILVFGLDDPHNIVRAVSGETLGTIIE